jgi:hypothetical protein
MWKRIMLFAVGAAVVVAAVLVSRAGAPPSTTMTTIEGSVLGFPGATGWTENECADVAASDLCLGQWRHDSGQVARVLLLPVPDPRKLASLSQRLTEQATASGGVAEVIDNDNGRVIRMLQPMRDADHGDRALVAVTYIITSPDQRSLHLLTSTVPLADEVVADGRVRDLLAFGVWIGAPAGASEHAKQP